MVARINHQKTQAYMTETFFGSMGSFCFHRLVWVVEINFVVSNSVLESNPLSLVEHHKRLTLLVLPICNTLLIKCCGPQKKPRSLFLYFSCENIAGWALNKNIYIYS
jgi:hypothetical protein